MFCKHCGNQLADYAAFCTKCGAQVSQVSTKNINTEPDPTIKWLIPIGRSGFAIASGYLGLLSVLMIPAPFALLFGILALVDIKKHPKKTGKGRAWFGIVIGGLGTVLLVLSLIAAAMG